MTRINFNIKYRPEIESGKYKVETRKGYPVRIVCWDWSTPYPILGKIEDDEEVYSSNCWSIDGYFNIKDNNTPFDLFIITDEEDEVEKAWKEGNDVGYRNGKKAALMGIPHWQKAPRDWDDEDIGYIVVHKCDGGDYPDYDVAVPTNRVKKGEWYLEICDLLNLPGREEK